MLTNIIAQDSIDESKNIIQESDSIVIVTHVGPDGDAMGSSLAMYNFLKKLQKENVRVIVPNKYPQCFTWMPQINQVLIYEADKHLSNDLIEKADLLLMLDFNTIKRVDGMSEAVRCTAAKKILIDHHPYPDIISDVTISHPEISSCSEIIFRFLCRMGYALAIDTTIAECIYTGMMTDTGNFSYNSNSPEIYHIIGELVKIGIDKDLIYSNVYNRQTADRLSFLGYCLSKKMKLIPEYNTALITISQKELEQFNYQPGDLEGVVNYPLSIEGIVFSVLMREDTDKIKISFRSKGTFPTNQVASELFNGGGHLNASGGESYETLLKTANKLKAALPNYF